MTTLSLVIPAYNEEQGIGRMIERVRTIRVALQEMGVDLELLVVDDGSADGTAAVAEEHSDVRLIRHKTNRGYGAALKTGFSAAQGEWLGFLDADGTYPPEFLPELCRPLFAGADLVVGSRRSGAESKMPPVRQVGNYIWSSLVTILGNHRVADPASGMRLVRRSALELLYPLPDGLNFTPVMSTRAVHEGLRVVEVPIPYEEREGRSKLQVVRDGMRFLRTILWTSLNYNPVRVLGGIGLAAIAMAILIGCVFIGMRLSGITTLGPWGVAGAFVASVLGLLGVDLLALGITFNYLVALAHRRPVRQGLFGRPILGIQLDRHFWWLGGLGIVMGVGMDAISFALALGGWAIDRLWLYLLAGTMLLLLGLQLIVFWVILRVLDGLSQREALARADIEASR
ncbi:MAG: glycosyltransferase family 2 protein [Anaerolineae bacterium]|nr:glycosyltransferase family 2 protein [Anaerolineae bacterium]